VTAAALPSAAEWATGPRRKTTIALSASAQGKTYLLERGAAGVRAVSAGE
jgi:hypothetical protein